MSKKKDTTKSPKGQTPWLLPQPGDNANGFVGAFVDPMAICPNPKCRSHKITEYKDGGRRCRSCGETW